MGFSCFTVYPLNAAHQNLPFPPNRTLPSKANAINQAWTISIFFKKYHM